MKRGRAKRKLSRQRIVELQQRLRQAGLRATTPRVVVLNRMEQAAGPVSHPELAEQLAREGYDRATVYRNLIDLSDAGLLTRSDLGDHIWRFEVASLGHAGNKSHFHFVCRSCGDVRCLPAQAVSLSLARTAPRVLKNQALELQLSGLCEGCV